MMLRVENLEKKFAKNIVFKNINLEIKEGERVVIIGPSGSGKSTFLRCLNRLEKPTKGQIYFKNELITDDNVISIRQKMGMVFQSINLFNNLSVLDNIILAPIKTGKMSEETATKEAKEYLRKTDLLNKINAMPKDLSGGQKQRIAIIRALMMKPEIMLFDEPTSALDPEMIDEVLNMMMDVASNGMTMVVVTHELNFARKFATRVLFIADGQILEDGTPDKVFDSPKSLRLKEFLAKL